MSTKYKKKHSPTSDNKRNQLNSTNLFKSNSRRKKSGLLLGEKDALFLLVFSENEMADSLFSGFVSSGRVQRDKE